jgi:microcompartment protein CcmL/EutN
MATKKSETTWHSELGTPGVPALGFVELSSISRGLYLTDVIVKKAQVKVISSQPVSSGKHVILYFGDVAAVDESHRAAVGAAENTLVRQVLIPGVHPGLVPFLNSLWDSKALTSPAEESVGIVESTTLAGAIVSADRALKSARVKLCRMRLGQGIGGKAYYLLTGALEEVEAAVEAAQASLTEMDSLARVDLIPQPMNEALAHF